MNTQKFPQAFLIFKACLPLGLALLSIPFANARVLDNFNSNTKTGWTDFIVPPGLGSITVANGQLTIDVPDIGQPLFAATTRNTELFTLQDGRTIEFRVDLVSGNDPRAFAVLSWIPTSQRVDQLAGYSIAKSSSDILVTKGLNKYFYNQTPNPPITNDNVTLVLRLTGSGADVLINTQVLDKKTTTRCCLTRPLKTRRRPT